MSESAETNSSVKRAETIASYKKLRIMQQDLHAMMLDQKRVLIMPHETSRNLSNAIDQIEQALELIKKTNTDSVVAEILIEIDGEFKL